MDINWLVVSVIGNILLGLYGAIFTTCTVVKANKEKKPQLSVSVSMRWRPKYRDGRVGSEVLLITVTNTGSKKVKVKTPYLELPSGGSIFSIPPLSPYRFPMWLESWDNCFIWMEMKQIKDKLVELGNKGIVKLKGKVSDATEDVYLSKESIDFNVGGEYD